MSEFKKDLAVLATAAAITIGGFVASQEMSAEYEQGKQDCVEKYEAKDNIATCQENLGRDESGALETFAYFGMITVAFAGWKLLDN